ncbi:hypothetical protein [Winogradskyella sp.]|uniref:hypothetical protein n=1 Tax=Winogradskyella sp. TaxID=1883156 RepID=UPI00261F0F0D|nr:hypothetical protein [Winogradskyella sp.]
MKKLHLLIGFLIGFTILACSSDDSSSDTNQETNRFYKKSEAYRNSSLVFDKTVNYNSNNKIQSILTNDYGYNTETITVTYSGNTITSINEIDEFDNPSNADRNVTYDVTIENNKITLESDDYTIEINHSNGYVNSTREFYPSNPNAFTEQIFTRDSNLNLVSNTTGDGSTFTYTDFDSDKMIDPFGSVMEYFYSDYFKIFDLKVTNSNPLTATYSQGSITDTYSQYLEYDELGYVIRTTFEPNSTTDYTEHEYIEL